MKHSNKPQQELDKAFSRIEAMQKAQNLDDFEEHWTMYLHHLERIWQKSKAHFEKSPKWNGWQGPFLKIRKYDPLITYLRNARNVEQHTVAEITTRSEAGFSINPGPSGSVHIKRLEIRQNHIFLDANDDIVITFHPERVKLINVINEGKTYTPPTSHQGERIDPNNVIDIAKKGANFYQNFLDRAAKHFYP